MREDWTRRFLRAGRRSRALLWDEEIELVPREYYGSDRRVGYAQCFVFDAVARNGGRVAGEIALRLGESPEMFYLGHIGYHIDPPFRGHSYALKGCRLCLPMLVELGQHTLVITTDPDNTASIRTCEHLGCELESTVSVPNKIRTKLEISPVKRRYVLTIPANAP